jgi:hypothetical protein
MIKKLIIAGFFTLLFFIQTAGKTYAAGDKTVYLPENETFYGLYFKTAETITIDGTIDGEAYLIASNVIVNGNINGDLIAIGGNIDINGAVSNNARLIGGNISISGPIGKNLLVVSGQNSIERKSMIGGNLVVIAENTRIFGKNSGEARIIASKIFYDGKSQKKVSFTGSALDIGKEADFSGNKYEYVHSSYIPSSYLSDFNKTVASKVRIFSGFASYFSYLVFGLILAFLFPKNFTNIDRYLNEKPLASFICGLLFYCLAPLIFILLILTLIGIPVALIFVFIVVFLSFISRIVLAIFLGSKILKDEESKFLPLLLGLSIIQVTLWIPFFGWVLKILIILLGTGSILLSKCGKYAK